MMGLMCHLQANEQIEADIQKMLVVFESNKKIPTAIMEAR
jgi:hypothetical protein